MDWTALKNRILELGKKNRLLLLMLLLGVLLMTFPQKLEKAESIPLESIEESSLEDRLSEALSLLEGAGKVKVLLTESKGKQTIYQSNLSGERSETVILSDGSRVQSGLIARVDPPEYMGAVVLCQGAGKASVHLSIVEAVANATGLSYDRISVLKLK